MLLVPGLWVPVAVFYQAPTSWRWTVFSLGFKFSLPAKYLNDSRNLVSRSELNRIHNTKFGNSSTETTLQTRDLAESRKYEYLKFLGWKTLDIRRDDEYKQTWSTVESTLQEINWKSLEKSTENKRKVSTQQIHTQCVKWHNVWTLVTSSTLTVRDLQWRNSALANQTPRIKPQWLAADTLPAYQSQR